MASSGYSQDAAGLRNEEVVRASQEAFTATVDEFLQKLEGLRDGTDSEDDSSSDEDDVEWKAVLTPVNFGRRVLLPTNQSLDIEDINALNEIYGAEQTSLNEAHNSHLTDMFKDVSDELAHDIFTREEMVEQFQAFYEKMTSTTNVATQESGLTSCSTTSDFSGHLFFLDHELLLEEFFQICQQPNDAEMVMLSVVCDAQPWVIRIWFEAKRKQKLKFFHAIRTATNKGGVGQVYRKQLGLETVEETESAAEESSAIQD